jgi:regulator of Ty1 transposition protein 109
VPGETSTDGANGTSHAPPHPDSAATDPAAALSNGTAANATASSSSNPPAPVPARVLAAAISCNLYTLPSPPDAPSSILYISKVDSSGYAPPTPITRVLASGLLSYFLSPETRPGGAAGSVTATLFARSQGQYLFPNSVEGGGKRVLGGLGLCQWWKSVYEDAARLTPGVGVELAYLLPSYSAAEAKGILGPPRRPPPSEWAYAPPFRAPLFKAAKSLATLIPSLPDDPKTRFLEELVSAALDSTPVTHKEGEKKDKDKKSRKDAEAAEDEAERRRAHAALARLPADEFWERMGFRQECASGDVTGFFSARVGPVTGEVGAGAEGTEEKERSAEPTSEEGEARARYEPPRSAHAVSKPLVERILTSMLNTDFGTRVLAYAGTNQWLASTRALVIDEVGEARWDASTATIAPKTTAAAAPPPKRKEETVTMLQPRKKKRT